MQYNNTVIKVKMVIKPAHFLYFLVVKRIAVATYGNLMATLHISNWLNHFAVKYKLPK